MGSVSVSSCKSCMFVSCVYHVAVLNAAFCMTCSWLMLVKEDARGDLMEETYSRAGLITALWVSMSVSFCLPHPVAVSAFMICSGVCACTEMSELYVSFGSKVRSRINLIIVPGMFVCISFLITVCMFIVSKALLTWSATVIVRAGRAIWLNPFATVLFSVMPSL